MGTIKPDYLPHLEHRLMSALHPSPSPHRPVPGADTSPAAQDYPASTPPEHSWSCPCCHATLRSEGTPRRGSCPACGSIIEPPTRAGATATTATVDAGTNAPSPIARAPQKTITPAKSQHRWFILSALTTLLVLAALAAWKVSSGPTTARPAAVTAAMPPTPEELRSILNGFLQADNWTAKRSFILDSHRLNATGAAYYNGRDPEEILAADFQPYTLPSQTGLSGSTTGSATLRAVRTGRPPVLAIFHQVGTRWQLDWEIFTQTHDDTVSTFLHTPSFVHRTLRVRLGRVFNQPGPASTLAVELIDLLDAGQRITFHLPVGSPIARTLTEGLSGVSTREASVEVCWGRPQTDGPWVPILHRLISWGPSGLHPELSAGPTPAMVPPSIDTEAAVSGPPLRNQDGRD